MNKIYLHGDVKLKNGGRKALFVSDNDLFNRMENILYNNKIDYYSDYPRSVYREFIKFAIKNYEKVKKDLSKIKFGVENLRDYSTEICTTRDTGFPYLCASSGNDNEIPVMFFIYYDGKNFRGYIPTKGNLFNAKTKKAFGNNNESIEDEIRGYTGKEITKSDLDYNENWMLDDFESRLEVDNMNAEAISEVLFEELIKKLDEKGYHLEETGMVCEDFERNFIFVTDDAELNDEFESRIALTFSYGDEFNEESSYISVDPSCGEIELAEYNDVNKLLKFMKNNIDLIVDNLINFYNEVYNEVKNS